MFDASARGNPLEFLDETYPVKTKGMWLPFGENFIILTSTVFLLSTRLKDRQTDARAIACAIAHAVARKNIGLLICLLSTLLILAHRDFVVLLFRVDYCNFICVLTDVTIKNMNE